MNILSLLLKLFFIIFLNFFCTSTQNKEDIKESTTKVPSTEFVPSSRMIIDNGLHSGEIRKASVDAINRFLVTGSEDRTVRVWDISNGQLLNILRPPTGTRNEGHIYAVAISPDGSTIAAAGWTGDEWDHSFSVYFFDRETGKIVQTIKDLPEVIYHIAYSPDGNLIAVTMGGTHGVRVYKLPDYKLYAKDSKYGDDSFGADFDYNNRLVTTSYDGYIRLYDSNFNLLSKEKTSSGTKPHNVHFAKNGSKIAVGYMDKNKVDIFSGQFLVYRSYLSLIHSVENKNTNGNLQSVAFSNDGEILYAGGSWSTDGIGYIRRWNNAGKGDYQDIKLNSRNVSMLLPYKERGAIVVTGHPSIQIINNNFETEFQNTSPTIDFGTLKNELAIFKDGTAINFDYGGQNKGVAYFSIRQRKIIFNPPENLDMMPPVKISSLLDIKNWQNATNPSLNQKPLPFIPGDISRSVAIAPDGKSFVLGSNLFLYHYNSTGKVNWRIPLPGIAWSLNISGNNKFVVAALSDGTIRWYRIKDGDELIAFLPHTDQKRWVVFTPMGYYDASRGGDELIGWELNLIKGKESLFFPSFAVERLMYKPEIIQKIINSIRTDKEVLAMLSIKPTNITSYLTDLVENIKFGEKSLKNLNTDIGKPFGKIFSVDPTDRNILITFSGNGSFIRQGERLFVLDDKTKIYLEITYMNHTMIRCKIPESNKKLIHKIKLNANVFLE